MKFIVGSKGSGEVVGDFDIDDIRDIRIWNMEHQLSIPVSSPTCMKCGATLIGASASHLGDWVDRCECSEWRWNAEGALEGVKPLTSEEIAVELIRTMTTRGFLKNPKKLSPEVRKALKELL